MARLALSLYLIVAAAAGPWWLCCCASARAAQFIDALKPAEPRPAPKCCCEHAKPTPEQAPAPKPLPHPPCSCRDMQPTPFIQTGGEADALSQLCRSIAADLPAQAAPSAASLMAADMTGPDWTGLLILPLQSGRDRLALLHILRC